MEIEKAIRKAEDFLFLRKDEDSLWRDFKSRTHGESIDWITSYVGLSLLNSGVKRERLEETANVLSQRQTKEGGWGYNHKIVPDADSTAFAIMFLSSFGYETELETAREFLLRHQNPDGSFSTFIPELINKYCSSIPSHSWRERIGNSSFNGWCSGIADVTATSLQALRDNNNAVEFLREDQQNDGRWRAYWWNNDIYSTSQGIKALEYQDCGVERARKWLSQQKLQPAVPFYLALSLSGLRDSEQRDGGIKSLIDLQQEDGNWESYPIMRFPHPSNLKPWENIDRWREEAKDQNRVFTTATCLEALAIYNESK